MKAEDNIHKRRRRLFPRHLHECVDTLTKPAFIRHGLVETRILRDWPKIMGVELGQAALPQKLTFPRGQSTDGVLTIAVSSGFALQLQYQTPVILEKLAVYFGYRAISRIVIKQTHERLPEKRHLPRQKIIMQNMPTASDDPLEAALERLGAAIKAAN